MYRRCLFCAADLGTNDSIEHFPVGRRLAFDGAKGRLWVVCRHCERWNLTPLDARWEAIEECEARFRETRLRTSTDNIGLARLAGGLELVRIGKPLRPEFAAWRYGDQFGRRRKRFMAQIAVGGALSVGAMIGSGILLGGGIVSLPLQLIGMVRGLRSTPIRVTTNDGWSLELQPHQVGAHRLRPSADGFQLEVVHRAGTEILTGPAAINALALLMPKVNASGANTATLKMAVRELEEVGDPKAYLARAELRARKLGWGYGSLSMLPNHIRLAVEMSAQEDQERAALEGELALLERAWQEAEAIAVIADNLTFSDKLVDALERLKRRDRDG
jgi:hypothetical protein